MAGMVSAAESSKSVFSRFVFANISESIAL